MRDREMNGDEKSHIDGGHLRGVSGNVNDCIVGEPSGVPFILTLTQFNCHPCLMQARGGSRQQWINLNDIEVSSGEDPTRSKQIKQDLLHQCVMCAASIQY